MANFILVLRTAFFLACLAVAADPAAALTPVTLPPPPATAGLSVHGPEGERAYTVAEIEALPLYRVVTTSPWEVGELTFEGVLLRDFLKLAGLAEAPAITIRAADGYTQMLPREEWADVPALLATRQDGRPLTRRTQGPIRLIYPLKDMPELDTEIRKPRWVWLIESIEAAKP